MKRVIDIELIDEIALELREKLCTLGDEYDIEDRNEWEYKAFDIVRNNLKKFIKE